MGFECCEERASGTLPTVLTGYEDDRDKPLFEERVLERRVADDTRATLGDQTSATSSDAIDEFDSAGIDVSNGIDRDQGITVVVSSSADSHFACRPSPRSMPPGGNEGQFKQAVDDPPETAC